MRLGTVAKATMAAGVESPDLAGIMKIDTTRIGRHDGTSLTEALRVLERICAGPIALLIDEAQHALRARDDGRQERHGRAQERS